MKLRTMRITFCLLVTSVLCLHHVANGGARLEGSDASLDRLTLVQGGKPASLIVTSNRPTDSQRIAAAELQQHIQLMSGATLPIFRESDLPTDPTATTMILVGASNLSRTYGVITKQLSPETMIVRTVDNALILAGEDGGSKRNARNGTLWAVYDFLQDQLGCRWIWPGATGRFVPRRTTIEVPRLDICETPKIKVRSFRLLAQEKHRVAYAQQGIGHWLDLGKTYDKISEDERVWVRRMRLGRSYRLSYGHAFTEWWQRYNAVHADIFAMQPDGKRHPRKKSRPDFVKMCVSNPTLWQLQLAPLQTRAEHGARGQWINTCENDGSGGYCNCPRCRMWDQDPNVDLKTLPPVQEMVPANAKFLKTALPANLSDRYARWYNELAVRVRAFDPEARVIAYAYDRYRSPPAHIDHIEPNVWIGYVGFNAYPRPASYRDAARAEWRGWSGLGATLFLRSNSLFYCGEGAPYVVAHQVAEDVRFAIDNGLRATDYDSLQGYWAASGPTYYVLARMLWDADADVDKILEEYYAAFGPMRQIVKEYTDYWERFTVGLGNDPQFFGMSRAERLRAYRTLYNDVVFRKAAAILERARPLLAGASADVRDRFRNIELGLEHGQLLAAALADGKISNGEAGEKLLAFRNRIAQRNVLNVYWTMSKEMRYHVFE